MMFSYLLDGRNSYAEVQDTGLHSVYFPRHIWKMWNLDLMQKMKTAAGADDRAQ